MSDVLANLAPYYFQIAYVVNDMAEAETFFQRTMGVKKFTRLDGITMREGCAFRGKPADSVANLSLGYLKDIQLELIEHVRGESLYSEFLADKGPGLHHVAFLVDDFAKTVGDLEGGGLTLAANGSITPGNDFAYFDCQGPGFSVIEILGFDEGTRGFMEMLRQQGRSGTVVMGAED
jgi:catechol 2,3-dioxygenase-like lactoylglutathione lyase family enzyme